MSFFYNGKKSNLALDYKNTPQLKTKEKISLLKKIAYLFNLS